MGFSESGRLQVDVKLASFATQARGRVQQVCPIEIPACTPCQTCPYAAAWLGPDEAAGTAATEG